MANWQKGDKFVYRGALSSHRMKTVAWEGCTGTIKSVNFDSAVVVWDKPYNGVYEAEPYLANLQKLPDVSIEDALTVLRAAGDVTFKPKKPPFTNIRVKLNPTYDAVVSSEMVTVGCQSFHFAVIEALHEAVQKAREHNKE
jgi:hypothetical protein